jgi:hypothetical protein
MSVKEVLEVAATVIGGLGGGGLIVFGLSGYLGKRWAESALNRQRQEYAQLNIALTQQLDLTTRRVQAELDTLSHLRKLKIELELEKVRELWKKIAIVRTAYHNVPKAGGGLAFADAEQQHKHQVNASLDFSKSLSELFNVWSQEMLSIPEHIADATLKLIDIARLEEYYALLYPDPFAPGAMAAFDGNTSAAFFNQRADRLGQFVTGAKEIESMMRKHIRGDAEDNLSRKGRD